MPVRVTNGSEAFEIDEKDLASARADGFDREVKVSNGKETFAIPEKDLSSAQSDGFSPVDQPKEQGAFDWSKQVAKEVFQNPMAAARVGLSSLPLQETAQAAISGVKALGKKIADPNIDLLKEYVANRQAQQEALAQAKAKVPTAAAPIELGTGFAVPMGGGSAAVKGLRWGATSAADALSRGEGAVPAALAGALGFGLIKAPDGAVGLAKKAGKKTLSALTGISGKAIEDYAAMPKETVAATRALPDIAQGAYDDLVGLKNKISQGSKDAYEHLGAAKGLLEPADINQIRTVADDALGRLRSGGAVGVGTPAKGSYNAVSALINDFNEAVGQSGTLDFPTAKKILQDIDQIEGLYRANPAEFTPDGLKAVKEIRNALRGKLGEKVPGYDDLMKPVAENMGVYKAAEPVVGDLNLAQQRLSGLAKPTAKRVEDIEAVNRLSQKTGSDYLGEIKNRNVIDQFDKDLTRGSRNVNLYALLGRMGLGAGAGYATQDNYLGLAGGAAAGAFVDKNGGKIARALLDLGKSRGMGFFGKFASPIIEAGKKGNRALAVEHLRLLETEPEYRRLFVQEQENEQPPPERTH